MRYEKVWFFFHPEISKAKEVLSNPGIYNSILSG